MLIWFTWSHVAKDKRTIVMCETKSDAERSHSKRFAKLGALESGGAFGATAPRRFSHYLLLVNLKIIVNIHPISLKFVNRFDLRGRSSPLKPCRRTPRILIRHWYQPVFHGILVHVIQPGQVTI